MQVAQVRTGVFHVPPGAVYGPRSLGEDWELLWVLDGSAVWTRDTQEMRMESGDLLLIPPGPDDVFAWDKARPTGGGAVHFRLLQSRAPLTRGATAVLHSMTVRDPLPSLCEYLLWLDTLPGATARKRACEVLALMVSIVVDGPQAGHAEVVELPPALLAVAAYAGRTWASAGVRALELGELARAASLSRRQLCRLTAEVLGMGPVKAFELVRLRRVATLLAHSNLTLSEIAGVCGYADPFHLSRRFNAEYGLAPSHYREHARSRVSVPEPPGNGGLRALTHAVDAAVRAWPRLSIA